MPNVTIHLDNSDLKCANEYADDMNKWLKENGDIPHWKLEDAVYALFIKGVSIHRNQE